jgi:hypothetical protein
MTYRLVEHYNDDIEIEDSVIADCFICYEFKITNEEFPINLKHQCYYLQVCSCNGWIHKTCLDTWCLKTNKCPMCRTHMTKMDSFVAGILKNNWFLTSTYTWLLRHIFRIIRFLFVCLTIMYLIETLRIVKKTYNSRQHKIIEHVPDYFHTETDINITPCLFLK